MNITKGQKNLLWVVFGLDVLAFILVFIVQISCSDKACDYTVWTWGFFILGLVLLFLLLGKKKGDK